MLGHLIKNYQGLFDHGIRPQGIYLDVFGYVPPDEDFNPEHPVTRTDAIARPCNCFTWSRNNLGFVGTEAACDWTVPYADFSSPLKTNNGIRRAAVSTWCTTTPYSRRMGRTICMALLNGGTAPDVRRPGTVAGSLWQRFAGCAH